jgi:hypothetical protein
MFTQMEHLMFFIVVYVHTFRGLYYGSYLYPKEHLMGRRRYNFIINDYYRVFRICVAVGSNVFLGCLQLLPIWCRRSLLSAMILWFGYGEVIQ